MPKNISTRDNWQWAFTVMNMVKSLHSPSYDVFKELLLQYRKKAGVTQAALVASLKKPQSYVSKYESGDRRLDFTEFMEIVDVLAINVAEFALEYKAKTGFSAFRVP